jgi:hypothetical protein
MMKGTNFQTFRYVLGHAILSSRLQWRYHGIGCLQAYFHEGDAETRVHIWHPSLVLVGFTEENGRVHDHRFPFTSHVMLGAIYNEMWGVTSSELNWQHSQSWWMYECVNAREAKEKSGTFHESLGRFDTNEYSVIRNGDWHHAGESYDMPAREFHFSKVNELTVTVVTKTGMTDGYARILGKKDLDLVHAFNHNAVVPKDLLIEAGERLIG